jgi:hypothetical protein
MIRRIVQRACVLEAKTQPSLVAAALLFFAAGLPAQGLKTPQVEGEYLGVTQLGVVEPEPTGIGLTIEIQDSRRFLGTLSYLEQDNLFVAGSISKSGKCQIMAELDEAQATIHLDWQNRGGGAATLLGNLTLTIDNQTQTGPVAFLRPYDDLAIDWSAQAGRHPATFTSAAGGGPINASLDITAGLHGILQATIPGWIDPDFDPVLPDPPGWIEPDPQPVVIGTTGADGGFVAVGVGSGANQIVTLTGNVTTDHEGQPLAIAGTYLIEHTTGRLIDLGTFHVLIAP